MYNCIGSALPPHRLVSVRGVPEVGCKVLYSMAERCVLHAG